MITDKLYKGRVIVTAAWVTGGILVRSQEQLSMSQSQQVFILGNDGYSYEVEPDTLGVNIGINDRNDTPIFTGDIVTGMWGVEFVVFYDVEGLEYKGCRTATKNLMDNVRLVLTQNKAKAERTP